MTYFYNRYVIKSVDSGNDAISNPENFKKNKNENKGLIPPITL